MTWKRSAALRKGAALAKRVPHTLARVRATPADYAARPPVLVNSFPKSGTHLLLQIVGGLPGVRGFGRFVASMPSLTFREQPAERTARALLRTAPAELVGAHLFHHQAHVEAIRCRRIVHYFIYRDPRDVVVSEAHYLGGMNRWHRLHRYFHELADEKARIAFAITGSADPDFPYDYPDVGSRFARYAAWLHEPDVCVVRFEDLVSSARRATVQRIVDFHLDRRGVEGSETRATIVEAALAAVNPSRSHTFRRGEVGGWRGAFDPELRLLFERHGGELLPRLGYDGEG